MNFQRYVANRHERAKGFPNSLDRQELHMHMENPLYKSAVGPSGCESLNRVSRGLRYHVVLVCPGPADPHRPDDLSILSDHNSSLSEE